MTAHKYHAKPVVIDGIRFASKKEGSRYNVLKIMQKTNQIECLICHPEFTIMVNNFKICKYVADFGYTDRETGEHIIEDVKGVRTAIYRLKKKLMKACHGIEILET